MYNVIRQEKVKIKQANAFKCVNSLGFENIKRRAMISAAWNILENIENQPSVCLKIDVPLIPSNIGKAKHTS